MATLGQMAGAITDGLSTKIASRLSRRIADTPGMGSSAREVSSLANRPSAASVSSTKQAASKLKILGAMQAGPPLSPRPPRRGVQARSPNSSIFDGVNSAMITSGAFAGAGAGALMGGTIGNREGTLRGAATGAMKGALAGAVVGTMGGVGLPAAGRAVTSNAKLMSNVSGYSGNIHQVSKAMNTTDGRRALFAGGGLLGGLVFGGNSGSKRRGFNRNRGSSLS